MKMQFLTYERRGVDTVDTWTEAENKLFVASTPPKMMA
jgi:hypothetical protein